MMKRIEVVDSPDMARSLLHPIQGEILERLRSEPGSSSTLGADMGKPRQLINYHLREMEELGLIRLHEERRKRNFIERLMVPAAHSWMIDPGTLGALTPSQETAPDRLSAAYLLTRAASLISSLSSMLRIAEAQKKKVATFTLDGEITFASAEDRAAFTEEVTREITRLMMKYGKEKTSRAGRSFSFLLGIHPTPKDESPRKSSSSEERSTR